MVGDRRHHVHHHGLILRRDNDREPIILGTKAKRILTVIAVLVYAFMCIGFTAMNVHESLGLPTALAMGIPALAALWKWINWYRDTEVAP
ncbi:MAG: hypothetical protein IJO82_01590, partial [Clostridia bacterium]|nr:hypothetical protein [Clostridia bacterium]